MKRVLLGVLLSPAPPVPFGAAAGTGAHGARIAGVCLAAVALFAVASFVVAKSAQAAASLLSRHRRSRGARGLTPEKIVGYQGPRQTPPTPEVMSRRIVERSEQIRRTLHERPPETVVEMCALGYGACLKDLLVLRHLVCERFPKADPFRRLMLSTALSRASKSVSRTRGAFPNPPDGDAGRDPG